jgi:hypothetical protein
MGNIRSEETKYADGEKHPVILDPTMVYEVNVSGKFIAYFNRLSSGWFQWTDTAKIPHQRKARSDDWKFSFTVSNCFISGREDTSSPIIMKV